jgi:hypothetical protein
MPAAMRVSTKEEATPWLGCASTVAATIKLVSKNTGSAAVVAIELLSA